MDVCCINICCIPYMWEWQNKPWITIRIGRNSSCRTWQAVQRLALLCDCKGQLWLYHLWNVYWYGLCKCIYSQKGPFRGCHWKNIVWLYRLAVCVWSCYEAFMDIECWSECICSLRGAFRGWHSKDVVWLYVLAMHSYSSCEAFIGVQVV